MSLKDPPIIGHAPERVEEFEDWELRNLQEVIAGVAIGLGYDNTDFDDMLWEDDLDQVRVVLAALGAPMRIHTASARQPQTTWEAEKIPDRRNVATVYDHWKYDAIRRELRFRGLNANGKKVDLIKRLVDDDAVIENRRHA